MIVLIQQSVLPNLPLVKPISRRERLSLGLGLGCVWISGEQFGVRTGPQRWIHQDFSFPSSPKLYHLAPLSPCPALGTPGSSLGSLLARRPSSRKPSSLRRPPGAVPAVARNLEAAKPPENPLKHPQARSHRRLLFMLSQHFARGIPKQEGESEVKEAQSCLTLCDAMDYTVHGILQARILEW